MCSAALVPPLKGLLLCVRYDRLTDFIRFGSESLQISDTAFHNTIGIDTFPVTFQRRVVTDLKRLESDSNSPRAKQGDAAMMLSECYGLGYGVSTDGTLMLKWLHRAALHGSAKAVAWYPRVNIAMDSPSLYVRECSTAEELEKVMPGVLNENYLLARLGHFESAKRRELYDEFRTKISKKTDRGQLSEHIYSWTTFNNLQKDELSLLHIAAWTGLDSFEGLASNDLSQINLVTKLGRTPLFYACLGGNTSTVRALIRCEGISVQSDCFGITPLHLCVFFRPEEAEEMISLLLHRGACLESSSEFSIEWEDHDIELCGTPIEWAVRCRHTHLVNILLEWGAEAKGSKLLLVFFIGRSQTSCCNNMTR